MLHTVSLEEMNEKQKLTKMYMPFFAACTATCVGFTLFLFAFASPYWLESYEKVHSTFLHMGVWSICFDGFSHPQDYHLNILTGCYWIYDRFFFKIGIWEWLNPYWLIAVQVLIIIAFIAELCTVIVLLLYFLLYGQPAAESTIAFGLQIFVGILMSIVTITFGIKSEDRNWMQRPDQNFLSWSYGFFILATVCAFISAGFLHCVGHTDRAAQMEVEFFEATEARSGLRSAIGGSYMRGRPSTMFSQSYYGSQSGIGGVVVNVPSTGNRPSQVLELGPYAQPIDRYPPTASVHASDAFRGSVRNEGESNVDFYEQRFEAVGTESVMSSTAGVNRVLVTRDENPTTALSAGGWSFQTGSDFSARPSSRHLNRPRPFYQ